MWNQFKMTNEAATRKQIIDIRLKEAGWNVADRTLVIEEFFDPTALPNRIS
jgi:type I restriction enzyme, R subunit